MARRSILGSAALVLACAYANPLATTSDGSSSGVRIGISSAKLRGDCTVPDACTVQLSMGHTGGRVRRVEVVAVHLLAYELDLGPIPTHAIKRWHNRAYREMSLDLQPRRGAKLSIELAPIEWEARVTELGLGFDQDPITVVVDLEIDGEPVVVRSMFTLVHETERVFVIT